MENGLAATATNTYGSGNSNTVKHYYAGTVVKTKKEKRKVKNG